MERDDEPMLANLGKLGGTEGAIKRLCKTMQYKMEDNGFEFVVPVSFNFKTNKFNYVIKEKTND